MHTGKTSPARLVERVYCGSDKRQVGCILGFSKNGWASLPFRDFGSAKRVHDVFSLVIFSFCQNQKLDIFVAKNYPYSIKKHSNYYFLKEYEIY